MQLFTEHYNFYKPWQKNKTALVLIHGLGANTKMWFCQIPDFSSHIPVITVDLPGCGQSPKYNSKITINKMAEELHDALAQFDYENYILLGISLGGFVTLEFANIYQNKTKAVIFASTPYEFEEQNKPLLFKTLKTYEKLSVKQIAEQRIPNAFKSSSNKELISYLIDLISETKHGVYIDYATAPLYFNSAEKFGHVKCPSLIITGDSDALAGPDQANKIHKKILNSNLYILKYTGHASSIDNPVEFNKVVLDYLISKIKIND